LLNVPVFLDWYPLVNSGFRVSTGALFNDNYLAISAQNQIVTVNNIEYAVTGLRGKIDFSNKISPYLGIGWGNAVNNSSRWNFFLDLGVAFVGSPNVKLNATASNPALQTELDNNIKKQIRKYKDDASQFQFCPVLNFGLSYSL